jgi:hypothetical protein
VCLVVLYKPLLSPEVVGKEYPWTVRRTRARKIRVGGCNDQRLKKKKKKRKEKRRRRTQDHDYSRTHNCFPWSMDMDVGPSAMGGGTTGNFWDRSHSAEVRAVRQNAAVIARSRKFRGKVLRMQSAELIRQKH